MDGGYVLALNPDQSLLAEFVAALGWSTISHLPDGETVAEIPVGALFAEFSPDGSLLATASSYEVRLWDVELLIKN